MHEKNRERTVTPEQNGKDFFLGTAHSPGGLRSLLHQSTTRSNRSAIRAHFYCAFSAVDTTDARQSACQDFNLEGSQFDLFKIFFLATLILQKIKKDNFCTLYNQHFSPISFYWLRPAAPLTTPYRGQRPATQHFPPSLSER